MLLWANCSQIVCRISKCYQNKEVSMRQMYKKEREWGQKKEWKGSHLCKCDLASQKKKQFHFWRPFQKMLTYILFNPDSPVRLVVSPLFYSHLTARVEKAMAPHSSTLAWKIPWTGEPGGLPSMRSYRVGHGWSDLAAAATAHVRLKVWLQSPTNKCRGGSRSQVPQVSRTPRLSSSLAISIFWRQLIFFF